jgi:tetratricopeptide (TPR) repeat protein
MKPTPLRSSRLLLLVPLLLGPAFAEDDDALRQARRLYAGGRFERALAAYRECSKSRPVSASALTGAGQCLIALGRIPEATRVMQRAARLPDAGAETHCVLGQAWYWAAASRLRSPDDPRALEAAALLRDAERSLKRALAMEERLHLAHCFLGKVKTAQSRPEEAAASFRKAIESRPSEPSYHFALGEALAQSERYAEAAAAYRAAAKHSPARFKAYVRGARVAAACCLARAGEMPRAVEEIQAVFLEDPTDTTVFRKIWTVFARDRGRSDSGRRLLEALAAASPDAALPYYYLGHFLRARGQTAEAREAFEKAVATEDGRRLAGVWADYGELLFVEGEDLAGAERCLVNALALEPQNRKAYTTLTYLVSRAVRARDIDRAIALTRIILKHQPQNGHEWGILAGFYHNRKQWTEALQYYAKAEQYAPEDPHIKMGLGKLHNEIKQYEKSDRYFTQALALDPDHLESLKDYGYLCRKTGQLGKARRLWERLLELDPGQQRIRRDLAGVIQKIRRRREL